MARTCLSNVALAALACVLLAGHAHSRRSGGPNPVISHAFTSLAPRNAPNMSDNALFTMSVGDSVMSLPNRRDVILSRVQAIQEKLKAFKDLDNKELAFWDAFKLLVIKGRTQENCIPFFHTQKGMWEVCCLFQLDGPFAYCGPMRDLGLPSPDAKPIEGIDYGFFPLLTGDRTTQPAKFGRVNRWRKPNRKQSFSEESSSGGPVSNNSKEKADVLARQYENTNSAIYVNLLGSTDMCALLDLDNTCYDFVCPPASFPIKPT